MHNELTIYTDGSSLGNPGPGGWGAIVMDRRDVVELGGREAGTTNNRMELTGLIEAFRYLAEGGVTDKTITVYADSKYVLDGLTKWLDSWKAKGWKKADGKPVLNQDLWMALDDLHTFVAQDNKLFFEHVYGHTGEQYNERVDDIARGLAEEKEVSLYAGKSDNYLK